MLRYTKINKFNSSRRYNTEYNKLNEILISSYRQVSTGISQVAITTSNVIESLQMFHTRRGNEDYIREKFRTVMENLQSLRTTVEDTHFSLM